MGTEESKPDASHLEEDLYSKALADVTLHVYDLGAIRSLNKVLRPAGTGAFHCGVEVYGREWSYAGCVGSGADARATGVFNCRPRLCKDHSYSESVDLGKTALRPGEVLMAIQHLEHMWLASEYSLLWHNCGHFCGHFCRALEVEPVPPWVMSLAGAGQAAEKCVAQCSLGRTSLACCSAPALDTFDSPGDIKRFDVKVESVGVSRKNMRFL